MLSHLSMVFDARIVEFLLVGGIVGLLMGLAHVGLGAGIERLPRWGAYVMGVGIILVGWVVWRGLLLGDWLAVVELMGLVLAGAVAPTLGRVVLNYRRVRRAQADARAAAEIAAVRREAGAGR